MDTTTISRPVHKMFEEEKWKLSAHLTIFLPRFEKHLTIFCHKHLTTFQPPQRLFFGEGGEGAKKMALKLRFNRFRVLPKRLGNYLSIQPQKTMRATWTRSCGVSFPSKQGDAPNARYLSYSLLATGSLLGIRPALLGLWSFKATGSAFCADYGFLTFMKVPSVRGTAPLTSQIHHELNHDPVLP